MKKLWFFLLSILVIVLDQMSKTFILNSYIAYHPEKILSFLNITLAYNTGSAFSFLSEAGQWHKWFFISFASLMSVVIAVWLLCLKANEKLQAFGLSLILGGAVGNLIDRIRLGHVIDFIDVFYKNYHWPVFNIADCAICIGALLLVFQFVRPEKLNTSQSL